MRTVTVDLGDRSYPIYIGAGVLRDAKLLAPALDGKQVLIVSNETVAPLFMDALRPALAGFDTQTLLLPDGEQYKNNDVLNTIFDRLMAERFSRDCTVLALGGGVVGDIAGLAAGCYQRGVGFVQAPTTLLAQVDSSVGGKTAINHPLGKNMIGVFHQPNAVLSDTETLATLPARELSAGLAEVIKYGLIRDLEFFSWLESNLDALLDKSPEALTHAIALSCEHKAAIVNQDEREHGARALLNLGHTFGHAIEAGLGFGTWLHGEAVAAGICMAADMSRSIGWLDAADEMRIKELMRRAGLPVGAPTELSAERLHSLMGLDKKVRSGRIRLVLPKGLGHCVVCDDFAESALMKTLNSARAAA